FLMIPPTPRSTLFPYTTLFRSHRCEVPGMRRRVGGTPSIGSHAFFSPHAARQTSSARCSPLMHISIGMKEPEANSFSRWRRVARSEEHTSELQSLAYLVCRLLL